MAKVVLLTGNHVCHNPRALKEADALAAAGFEVEWLGAWFDHDLANRDRQLTADRTWRFTPVLDWTGDTNRMMSHRNRQRATRWMGQKLHNWIGHQNQYQLGYCVPELLRSARAMRADLFIAHSEPAMWVASELLREGRRVGIDMEDWFSEDLLPDDRKERPLRLLQSLERELLTESVHRTCTSAAMAGALAKAYRCEPPTVVYNAFPLQDACVDHLSKDRPDKSVPSLHWFSQVIGPGRGLEDLFGALAYVQMPAELHLRGQITSSRKEWLHGITPESWRHKVHLHPVVHNSELPSRIAEHDIGVASEFAHPPSRDLTITNKILQYLVAGLAVVASRTAGQAEVASRAPQAVRLYSPGQPAQMAEAINTLLASRHELLAARAAARRAVESVFCWERVEPQLLDSVRTAIH